MARTPKTPATEAKTRGPAKAKTAALAKTPRAPRAKKAEPIVEQKAPEAAAAPTPLAGTSNRYAAGSVTPDQAYHYAALAHGLELDFGHDEKAMRRYRSRLYQINKEFTGKWRFRTIRENFILMIWRLAY